MDNFKRIKEVKGEGIRYIIRTLHLCARGGTFYIFKNFKNFEVFKNKFKYGKDIGRDSAFNSDKLFLTAKDKPKTGKKSLDKVDEYLLRDFVIDINGQGKENKFIKSIVEDGELYDCYPALCID